MNPARNAHWARALRFHQSALKPTPAMAQIQNAGFTTRAAFHRSKKRPYQIPIIEAYSRAYWNVQNQNF